MALSANTVVEVTAQLVGAIAQEANDYTLGAQQLLLLMALYTHRDGISQSELHKWTGVERTANSRNIAKLGPGQWNTDRKTGKKTHESGYGWVQVTPVPTNQRENVASLTPQGRAVIDQLAAHVGGLFKN